MVLYDTTFKQYFSYIMVVSFIGGGNRSNQRKPLTSRRSRDKLNHIMFYHVHLA